MNGSRTFVGFGFGAIQSGLFVYEAWRSGAFGRIVVAEVMPEVVAAIRANDGFYGLNIATPDGIERVTVGPVEILNPRDEADRRRLVAAVREADEMATALPSVKFFDTGDPGDVLDIFACGLRGKTRPAVVYTGENHNHAAEILAELVEKRLGQPLALSNTQMLNTVIGKMSSVVTETEQIVEQQLLPMVPGGQRAFLVEAFNRILVSQVGLPGYRRGLAVFEEKEDLLPFEEAKLYGHNAVHALLGYLADARGLRHMSETAAQGDLMRLARQAFIGESGAGLIHKYGGRDPLFTPEGFAAYADDLLVRMVNPHLRDPVARVIRDPLRKLGWDDRLIGAMRLALGAGVEPVAFAEGVRLAGQKLLHETLLKTWPAEAWTSPQAEKILACCKII